MLRRQKSRKQAKSVHKFKVSEENLWRPTPTRTPRRLKKRQCSSVLNGEAVDPTSTALHSERLFKLPADSRERIRELETALAESRSLNHEYAAKLAEAMERVHILEAALERERDTTQSVAEYKKQLLALYQQHLFDFHRRFSEQALLAQCR